MRDLTTIIMALFLVMTLTTESFGQIPDYSFSIEETNGFCYDIYSHNNKEYKVCYGRPTFSKTLFHFSDAERKCFILQSKRFSPTGMNSRILILDIKNNIVQEIDSCYDKNNGINRKDYLATSGDTVYLAYPEKNTIIACLFSKQMTPAFSSSNKSNFLNIIEHHQDINTWCVTKNNKRLAYKRNEEDSITVISEYETVKIPSGFSEVLAWRDENHLFYTKIEVKGMGDFFYDLYEYNIQEKKSNLILEGLLDVYDFYSNLLLYSTSHNKLTVARLNGDGIKVEKQLDLSTQFEWIYSAYIINDDEFIIGGDKDQTDCHYFKCRFSIAKD